MESRVIDLDAVESYLRNNVLSDTRLTSQLTHQIPDKEIGAFVLSAFNTFGGKLSVEISGTTAKDETIGVDLVNKAISNPPITLIFKDVDDAINPTSGVVLMYDDEVESWIKVRSSGNPLVNTYPFIVRLGKHVCNALGLEINSAAVLLIKHVYDRLKAGK